MKSAISDDSAVRANVVRRPDGKLSIYGGNFQHKADIAASVRRA
ncbi:MAG: hypothetical protein R3D62_16560 [Xanthobacteraceae bacterium]